jgi:hypothetical protein
MRRTRNMAIGMETATIFAAGFARFGNPDHAVQHCDGEARLRNVMTGCAALEWYLTGVAGAGVARC